MRRLLLLLQLFLLPLPFLPATAGAGEPVEPGKVKTMAPKPVKRPDHAFPPRPVPSGETFRLEQHASHTTKSGLVVHYAAHTHKRRLEGHPGAQMVRLALTRGARSETVELRTSDNVLEAELDALGSLMVVTGGSAGITVVVAAEKAPKPLTEDEAWALVDEAAAARGMETEGGGGGAENGVLRYTATVKGRPAWRARVGLWTRRLWFLAPDGGGEGEPL